MLQGEVVKTTVTAATCDKKWAESVGLKMRTPGTKFSLKGLTLETRAVADESQRFLIEATAEAFQSSSLEVALSPIQSLSSGKSSVENHGWAFATSTVKVVGGLVGSVIAAFVGGAPEPKPKGDQDQDGIPDVVDACPKQKETYNGVHDGDGCPEVDKCEFVVNEIESLRASRNRFMSFGGNVAASTKELYVEALTKLDAQEAALVAILTGEKEVAVTPFQCRFFPVNKTEAQPLLSLDPATGKLTPSVGECALPPSISGALPAGPQVVTIQLQTIVTPFVQKPAPAADAPSAEPAPTPGAQGAEPAPAAGALSAPLPGLPYRIPAQARALIAYDGVLVQKDLVLPQFGAVAFLPTNKLKEGVDFKFDPDTGALLSFAGKRSSTTIDTATAAEGAKSALDSISAQRRKIAEKEVLEESSAIGELERKAKRLELQKKIEELEQAGLE